MKHIDVFLLTSERVFVSFLKVFKLKYLQMRTELLLDESGAPIVLNVTQNTIIEDGGMALLITSLFA
jgi:hypothetical protein